MKQEEGGGEEGRDKKKKQKVGRREGARDKKREQEDIIKDQGAGGRRGKGERNKTKGQEI